MTARPIGRGNTAHDDEEAVAPPRGRAAIDEVRRRLADAPVVVGRSASVSEPVEEPRPVDVAPSSWPVIVLFLILVGSAMAAGGIVLAGWADVGVAQAVEQP